MAGSLDEHRKTLGRPSVYSPAYCNEIIEFMGLGYSLTAFAGHIGVARDTVYAWEAEIPAFSDAIKKARAKRTQALERGLLTGETARMTAHIFALKNADPDEWREKVVNEHTGKDGGAIQITDETRVRALAAFLAKTAGK